jgi:hypothetical protein
LVSKPTSKPVLDSLEIEVLAQIRKDKELIFLDEVKVKAKRIEEKDGYGITPSVIVKDQFISTYQNAQMLVNDLIRIYCPAYIKKGLEKGFVRVFMIPGSHLSY